MKKKITAFITGLLGISGAVFYDDIALEYRNTQIANCETPSLCWANYLVASSQGKDLVINCPTGEVVAKNIRTTKNRWLTIDIDGIDTFHWQNDRGDLGMSPVKQLKYEICEAVRIKLK